MAYVAEGLGDLVDWNEVMKFQRKDGSLFNSPSATAFALIHEFSDQALQYLNLLVSKFGSAGGLAYFSFFKNLLGCTIVDCCKIPNGIRPLHLQYQLCIH